MHTKLIPMMFLLAMIGCGGDGAPTMGGGGSGGSGRGTGGGTGGNASFYCCLNGAFFSCPSQQAVDKCVPPNFTTQPDPSSCTRDGAKDGMCNMASGGHGGGGSGGGGGGGTGGSGGGGGSSSGAKPGDLCDGSSAYCTGNVLICVTRTGDASGTCRSPCDTGHSCIGQGLSFNSCCPLSNAATSVCIPNDQVPSGANCGP